MKINAHAKINLGLDVVGKREDGYHEVRMIMQTIELHDELTVERTEESRIQISTDREDLSVGKDNLIHKAAKLLMDEYDLPGGIKVQLKKNIPVAAGLAGGSTDAAATMIAVNELFDLGLTRDELMKRGVRIGADVPYCIMGGTALSEGIGEILTPIGPCPEWRVLIAKPPVSVSTAHVYHSFRPEKVKHPDIDMIAEGIAQGDFHKVVSNMGNVLESVTMEEVPYIGKIKNTMADQGYPLMSGSGPTVFGLFETDEAINRAYGDLKKTDHVEDLVITRICDPGRQVN
jgi:4-diphosphocytidyl-2-C-methyl-D-erythritol kinase